MLNALNNLASGFSNASNTITALQKQIDQQAVNAIGTTNQLIRQVYDLNSQVRTAIAAGDTGTGLLDQRDVALDNLAKTMGIKTTANADGSVTVSTNDGVNLVSNTYAQLTYAGGAQNGSYGNITVQDTNPQTGQAIGAPQAMDPHLDGGSLKGLIDMRDQVLSGLNQTLGNLAQQTALAFNAQSNANAAYPPPSSLTGRNTGLLTGDALNFSGKTMLAVTDPSGKLVSRVDVDFSAGTLSVNGGAATSIGTSVGSFTTALNSALGGAGTASFSNGQLSIAATGGNGVLVQDDASSPSARGGVGFSQFFGLNDLFQSQMPSVTTTGLSASDSSGLAAGGKISLSLKGPDGDIARNVSITTTAGQTIGDVVTALNVAMGGGATFTLGSDGSISTATSALYPGYGVNVTGDSTVRGNTGVSFSTLFGLGPNAQASQATGFSVTSTVANNPARVGFATPKLTSVQRAGRHHRVGRRQFRRHRAAERHQHHPAFQVGRRHRRPGRVAVGLCRQLLPEPVHPIEQRHRQPDHPGRPAEGGAVAPVLQLGRQPGRRIDVADLLPAGLCRRGAHAERGGQALPDTSGYSVGLSYEH